LRSAALRSTGTLATKGQRRRGFLLDRLWVPNESIEFRTRDADGTRYALQYNRSDFYRVFAPTNATAALDPANLYPIRIDAGAFPALYEAKKASFTTTVASVADTYDVSEDVYAAYRQGSTRPGDVTLLGGLRYERSDVSLNAFRAAGSTLTEITTDGGYDKWLPFGTSAERTAR
jgi:hypothetical protein